MKRAYVVVGFQSFRCLYAVHHEFCGLMNFYWHRIAHILWLGGKTCDIWPKQAMYQAQNWQMAQRGLQMQGMAASGQDRFPGLVCADRRGLGLASQRRTRIGEPTTSSDHKKASNRWLFASFGQVTLNMVWKRIARDKLMEVEVPGPTTTWSECICLGLSHFLGDSARSDIW